MNQDKSDYYHNVNCSCEDCLGIKDAAFSDMSKEDWAYFQNLVNEGTERIKRELKEIRAKEQS